MTTGFRRWVGVLLAVLLLWPQGVLGQASEGGQVQIPLETYQALVRGAGSGSALPAGYALRTASAEVRVDANEERLRAFVSVDFSVQVFEDDWTLVPMLPSGSLVVDARVDGSPIYLLPTPAGLMWAVNAAGVYTARLVYEVEATSSAGGYTLALPLPPAPSTRLSAVLPGEGLAVAVIPASRVTVSESGGLTELGTTVPSGGGVQISWRADELSLEPSISRAVYRGEAGDQAVRWRAEYRVEVPGEAPVMIDLLPAETALLSLWIDGEEAPVGVRGGAFTATLRGPGTRVVEVEFEVPVGGQQGQPRVEMHVPQVPVSRFELTLAGEKDVVVEPRASVEARVEEGQTRAVVHVPMTDRVVFSWLEAVPEPELEELVANASIYHAASAEEGVLTVRAIVQYEITRGEASQFSVTVPAGAQINRITSPGGTVVDWRLAEVEGERVATVFLDRRVRGSFRFDIEYERLLGAADDMPDELALPLLHAREVSRQRGMVALLSSRDLALEPVGEVSLIRVGENQLPAFVREGIEMTVAHTYRYFEVRPELTVRAQAPERRLGRFDARVDTLVSLGDVTITAVASVEIQVKAGSTMAQDLFLPAGVNLLALTAPSLRDYRVDPAGEEQRIAVEFTREMEGQFRIEVTYERIALDDDEEVEVPLLRVGEAEVEQGRVAVEALSAVEVRPAAVEHLSSLELSSLPQQLILRTTNPILLAFRYVQAEPRPRLGLRVTRHQELEVQAAIIDRADYRTLVTDDGFAVTTARFTMRNSREQFLRVALPADSEVWSASVDGQAERPALATGSDGAAPQVLVNIINSAEGFPVELVYVTRISPLGFAGTIEVALPTPDMVVTQTHWDLDLPADMRYGRPRGPLDLVAEGVSVSGARLAHEQPRSAAGIVQPLGIAVPESGVRFSFEKLYANQAGVAVTVSIPYSSQSGVELGGALTVAGALLGWLGLIALFGGPRRRYAAWAVAAAIVGCAAVLVGALVLDAPLDWAGRISVLGGAVLALGWVSGPMGRWYAQQKEKVAARRAVQPVEVEAAPAAPPPPTPESEVPETEA